MTNEQKIENLKKVVSRFISGGGDVNELKTTDEVYKLVKNTSIIIDKHKLSVEEKFELIGFPRQAKRKSFDEHLKSLRDAISEFVAGGGDVNLLCCNDKLYKKVKNAVLHVDGKELTINEKFDLAGFPRENKYNNTKQIIAKLNTLENFKDEKGFVDAYRKDAVMNAFIDNCSLSFQMPPALVVALLANQNLKKYALKVDRYDYIKSRLSDYIKQHGNLVSIKQNDRRLYDLLCSSAKSHPTEKGVKMTLTELVSELGFGDVENGFIETNRTGLFDENKFFEKYYSVIKRNGNKISLSDIDTNDYMRLSNYTRRLSISIKEFFERNGVGYISTKKVERNAYLTVDEYPYLEEMREELYKILAGYIAENPELASADEETLFTVRLEACKFVYNEFKQKISEKYSEPLNSKAKEA